MKQEIIARLALIQIPGIGDLYAKLLTEYFKGAKFIFSSSRKELSEIPGIGSFLLGNLTSVKIKKEVFVRAEKELNYTESNNISILLYDDENYPKNLKDIDDSPYLLFYKGTDILKRSKMLSIVGTRKSTNYGQTMTRNIVNDLKDQDIIVVSGLAYGIDTYAHEFSVDNNIETIGVLAHGLDRIYPYKNSKLAEKMLAHGGLLTEFFSGTNPDRENFPKRNRIVAGISKATVVVEATVQGGALITTKIASSYGREVFAVPGRAIDPYSSGCNHVIKNQTASIIMDGTTVLEALNWEKEGNENMASKQMNLFTGLTKDEERIIDVISRTGKSSKEAISIAMGVKIASVSQILFSMEMKGLIESVPGNNFQLSV